MKILILGDDKISFSSKAQIFYYVATRYDKKWYSDYVNTFGNMNKDLVEVIENRNVFAHRVFESEPIPLPQAKKAKEGYIRFMKFKNGIDTIDYNNEKFMKLIDTILKLAAYIAEKNNSKLITK